MIMTPTSFFILLLFGIAVFSAIIAVGGDSSNNNVVKSEDGDGIYLKEIPFIKSKNYTDYTFLDYSVREISYPEENTRYYAVVTITGHDLGNDKANAIIHFDGKDKDDIYNYDLIPNDVFGHIFTFDRVKEGVNRVFKSKASGIDSQQSLDWRTELKKHAYYFNTKEDATFAVCQFKKHVDERFRKKELSINDVSENVTTIKFE